MSAVADRTILLRVALRLLVLWLPRGLDLTHHHLNLQ